MNIVALGEVVTIRGGGTPDKSVAAYWNGSIPWASVKDFKDTTLTSTIDRITEAGVAASATQIIPAGNIIVPTRMAVGKAAINTIDLAINQDLKALIPSDGLDRRYLLHTLLANAKKLEDQATGATVKGIKLDALRSLQIPLPPLPEQKRIAGILDEAARLCRLRARAIEKLNTLGQAVFQEMFGDRQCAAMLGNTCLPVQKIAPMNATSDQNFTYIDIAAVDQKMKRITQTQTIPCNEAPSRARQVVQTGDILVSTVRPNLNSVAIVGSTQGLTIASTGFCVLRPNPDNTSTSLIYEIVKSHSFINKMINMATGASYPAVTDSIVKSYMVPQFSDRDRDSFSERLAEIEHQQSTVRHALINTQSLFASLQHRAFRGEL